MRIRVFLLSFVLIQCVLFSCINNQKKTAALDKLHRQDKSGLNIIGSYFGNLPCVDCDAIQTFLTLNRDYTYKMNYIYKGKSGEIFTKEGNWDIKNDFLELVGLDYKYKIEPELLVQLDLSGKEILGDISEKYQLTKVE